MWLENKILSSIHCRPVRKVNNVHRTCPVYNVNFGVQLAYTLYITEAGVHNILFTENLKELRNFL